MELVPAHEPFVPIVPAALKIAAPIVATPEDAEAMIRPERMKRANDRNVKGSTEPLIRRRRVTYDSDILYEYEEDDEITAPGGRRSDSQSLVELDTFRLFADTFDYLRYRNFYGIVRLNSSSSFFKLSSSLILTISYSSRRTRLAMLTKLHLRQVTSWLSANGTHFEQMKWPHERAIAFRTRCLSLPFEHSKSFKIDLLYVFKFGII